MKSAPEKYPSEVPEPGFYYHFKHDPAGPLNNYAYEVIGTGKHTEEDCPPADKYMVIYLPLYEDADAYKNGRLFNIRPLKMFMEDAKRNGPPVPRFHKITNPEIIAKLKDIKRQMYR